MPWASGESLLPCLLLLLAAICEAAASSCSRRHRHSPGCARKVLISSKISGKLGCHREKNQKMIFSKVI